MQSILKNNIMVQEEDQQETHLSKERLKQLLDMLEKDKDEIALSKEEEVLFNQFVKTQK